MKKNVLVFGLIAGLIVTALMIGSVMLCYKNDNYEGSEVIGYAGMIVAFSFIFIGVKNFRDKYNGGIISFGKAFKTGLYITLVASTLYVVAWLIQYYCFFPDFMDKYTAHVLKQAQAGGASQLEMSKKTTEMTSFKEMYKNPLFVVLMTYMEILPVGLVVTLISALILKRKSKNTSAVTAG